MIKYGNVRNGLQYDSINFRHPSLTSESFRNGVIFVGKSKLRTNSLNYAN